MSAQKDVKPIFDWAKENGDCAIVERIIVKLLPKFLGAGIELTASNIDQMEEIIVDEALYEDVKHASEELVNRKCQW